MVKELVNLPSIRWKKPKTPEEKAADLKRRKAEALEQLRPLLDADERLIWEFEDLFRDDWWQKERISDFEKFLLETRESEEFREFVEVESAHIEDLIQKGYLERKEVERQNLKHRTPYMYFILPRYKRFVREGEN